MFTDEDLDQIHEVALTLETERAQYWACDPYRRPANLRNRYGLTLETWGRMAEAQDGRCAVCGCEPDRLDIDHCHATGRVRGLLCRRCNLLVGWLEGVTEKELRAVQNYLKDPAQKTFNRA
jgi:hypothetical protein